MVREGRERGRSRSSAARWGLVVLTLLVGACSSGTEKSSSSGVASGAATGAATAPGLAGCVDRPLDCNSGERATGGTVTWALADAWSTYNVLRVEGADVNTAQALAGTAPAIGDFQPDGTWRWNRDLLASDPKVTSTAPQTMVYELRPEAVWSDGVPISVDDFRYEWFHQSGRDDQCSACNPKFTVGWEDVANVDGSPDGRTVTITLKDGITSPEWFALYEPSPNPAHLATTAGFDWHTPDGMGQSSAYFRDTVPTWSGGPYLIDSVVAGERVVMVPNPRWYGTVRPTLETLVKEVVPPDGLALAVQNSEVDGGTPRFDPDLYQQLHDTDGVTTSLGAGDTWEHLDLNLKTPALQDLALRKAILTAIDTLDARARIYGDAVPPLRTNHFFASSSPHHEDLLQGTGFGTGDADAARAILTAAGYTGADAGQHLAKGGVPVPALRIALPAGSTARGTFVELAQASLAQLGIELTPEPIPAPSFLKTLGAGDYDLSIWALSAGSLFTTAPSQFFASASPVNFTGLADPAIDRAAADVPAHTDVDDAAAAANKADALIVAQAVNLPLWDSPALAFASNRVIGVRDDGYSYVRAMYEVQAWGIRPG